MQRFLKVLYSPLIAVVFGGFLCCLAAMYAIDNGISSSSDMTQVILGMMMGCGFCILTSGIFTCLSRHPAGSPS